MQHISKTKNLVAFPRVQKELLRWYRSRSRDLPWRKQNEIRKDPYAIWLSEVMLQQTTSQAVIPYYEKFLARYPTVHDLARAPIEDILSLWAGLGYYQRARLLHKAAQVLSEKGFPTSWSKLIELPGFGPYTARAVSSLAFGENVGLVDGNVIRVLSRYYELGLDWWSPKGRAVIQDKADALVKGQSSSDINQALMDLGATICTPQSPSCWDCPWSKSCGANQSGQVTKFPRAKPKKAREIWIWRPRVLIQKEKVALVENTYAPFLKGQWILPGTVERGQKAPTHFDYKHVVTHHDIYVSAIHVKTHVAANVTVNVTVNVKTHEKTTSDKKIKWCRARDVRGVSPTSLVFKTLQKIHPELFQK